MEYDKEKIVDILNNVAIQFEKNGADLGGTYASNEHHAMEALKQAMCFFGISEEEYEVKETKVVLQDDCGKELWHVLQIVKKGEEAQK